MGRSKHKPLPYWKPSTSDPCSKRFSKTTILYRGLSKLKVWSQPGVVAHAFSSSSGGIDRHISDFMVCLVYEASSKIARAIERNTVSKKPKRKKKKKNLNPHFVEAVAKIWGSMWCAQSFTFTCLHLWEIKELRKWRKMSPFFSFHRQSPEQLLLYVFGDGHAVPQMPGRPEGVPGDICCRRHIASVWP